jgi:allantoinase
MTDFALVLQGAVILPDRILSNGYVAVADGKIAEIGQGHAPSARESHRLGAAFILPGAIDAQVHSLSQKNQEDFIWSTRAAAAGGVTTIIDMPYDEGDLISSAAAVKRKAAHAAEQARVDFAVYGTVDPEEGAARIAEQAEAGSPPSSSRPSAQTQSGSRASQRRSWRNVSRRSRRPGSLRACTMRTTNTSAPAWRR